MLQDYGPGRLSTVVLRGSNSTIVGLKLNLGLYIFSFSGASLNSTIIGLKQVK